MRDIVVFTGDLVQSGHPKITHNGQLGTDKTKATCINLKEKNAL